MVKPVVAFCNFAKVPKNGKRRMRENMRDKKKTVMDSKN
jgi:hypothetical protein